MIDALEANWSRFEAKGVSDLGILIDWCGLYQAPRDDEQQRVFEAALKAINQARSRPCPGARHMHTKGHTGCRMATRCMAQLALCECARTPLRRSGMPTAARRCGW